MRLFKKSFSFFLAAVMVFSVAGCKNGATTSDNNSNVSGHRPPYVETDTKEEYEDTDGIFEYKTVDWKGPEGYVIIIPNGNAVAKKTAELLQNYYQKTHGVSLAIVSDNSVNSEKEILIGKTNRQESNQKIDAADLEVSIKNNKLVFDGGHNVTVDSAVKKFIRLSPKTSKAVTFKITTDFKTKMLDGYEYVWGDEFEGDTLDSSKWALIDKMGSVHESEVVSTTEKVINVESGRLKLHAIRYFDSDRKEAEYLIPCSVVTQKNMNYVYGYTEIRARVPFSKGVWASFWTQTTAELKGKRNKNYMLEVDIFEIFKGNLVSPNLIKWYTSEFDYNKRYMNNENGGIAVNTSLTPALDNPNAYEMEVTDKLNWEYHIYGFEWTPTEISMYIDGKKYTTFDTTKSYDLCDDQSGFSDPMFLIFNNGLFFENSESVPDVPITQYPESLPGCFYIDYCRVYQKPNVGELYINEKPYNTQS